MTASAIQGDREKCLESGMNNYLAKPVRAQTLKLLLESYLAKEEEVIPNLQAEANKLVKEALSEVVKDDVKVSTNGHDDGPLDGVDDMLKAGSGNNKDEKSPSRPASIRMNTTQLWRPHDDANGKDESGPS
jgi:response regulator of citrate/malate metabolism